MGKSFDFESLWRGKPVDPPSAPPPQANYKFEPYTLFLPYAIEESARTFLHLLAEGHEVPTHVQNMIKVWLQDYDVKVLDFLQGHYGPGVTRIADAITAGVLQAEHHHAESEAKAAVDQEIGQFENQFKDDDGAKEA